MDPSFPCTTWYSVSSNSRSESLLPKLRESASSISSSVIHSRVAEELVRLLSANQALLAMAFFLPNGFPPFRAAPFLLPDSFRVCAVSLLLDSFPSFFVLFLPLPRIACASVPAKPLPLLALLNFGEPLPVRPPPGPLRIPWPLSDLDGAADFFDFFAAFPLAIFTFVFAFVWSLPFLPVNTLTATTASGARSTFTALPPIYPSKVTGTTLLGGVGGPAKPICRR